MSLNSNDQQKTLHPTGLNHLPNTHIHYRFFNTINLHHSTSNDPTTNPQHRNEQT